MQRVDTWLWCARLFRTRTLATKIVANGGIRLTRNGRTTRIEKPSTAVKPGDSIAYMAGGRVRIVQIRACAARRGPAREARLLYTEETADWRPASSEANSRPDDAAEKQSE